MPDRAQRRKARVLHGRAGETEQHSEQSTEQRCAQGVAQAGVPSQVLAVGQVAQRRHGVVGEILRKKSEYGVEHHIKPAGLPSAGSPEAFSVAVYRSAIEVILDQLVE